MNVDSTLATICLFIGGWLVGDAIANLIRNWRKNRKRSENNEHI